MLYLSTRLNGTSSALHIIRAMSSPTMPLWRDKPVFQRPAKLRT
jgi:hypothetical protein